MRYEKIRRLPDGKFRRLTGVKPRTFEKMLEVLTYAERGKRRRGGKASEISLPDRLLMTLEYWREYRTYFHISQSYGLSEGQCYYIIRWVEDTLIKSGEFSLPGRKALLKSDMEFEVVMIDATESPCERPKKNRSATTPAKRSATPRKTRSSS
jgi:Helix-turn-helix of DDE superfamily endonuclease